MRRRARLRAACLAAAAVLGAAGPAAAGDGVIELNHTCAVHTGCDLGAVLGDAPGYPITLTGEVARSYRLTSDLVVPDEAPAAIVVMAPRVSIDLNGFAIVRAGCAGATAASECRPGPLVPPDAAGILAGPALGGQGPMQGITVRNGAITGMVGDGVRLGRDARVSDLRVRWNAGAGIAVGGGSEVTGCAVYQNGAGIEVRDGGDPPAAEIVRNAVLDNLEDGIDAPGGARIVENAVLGQGEVGIDAGAAVIARNAVLSNGGHGIAAAGAVVVDNVVGESGEHGIVGAAGCLVRGNAVSLNLGFGLSLAPDCGYRGNDVGSNNTAGTVSGGTDRGRNACGETAGCP